MLGLIPLEVSLAAAASVSDAELIQVAAGVSMALAGLVRAAVVPHVVLDDSPAVAGSLSDAGVA
jgi:hypothetical protein